MDVRSSRKEFLICGTFKINSIEKEGERREREREREDSYFCERLSILIQNILITSHYIIISVDVLQSLVVYYKLLHYIMVEKGKAANAEMKFRETD